MENDILIIGVLFPAIPLAMVALNGRYSAIAGLMRAIHDKIHMQDSDPANRARLITELRYLMRRMAIIRLSLLFGALSFVANLMAIFACFVRVDDLSAFSFALAILLLTTAMMFFVAETCLSTKALTLHLADLKHHGL